MKRFWLSSIVGGVVALAATPVPAVVLETETTLEDGSKKTYPGRIEIDGQRMRIDSSQPKEGGGTSAILFDAGAERVTILEHEKRRYTVLDRAAMEAFGSQIRAAQSQMQAQMEQMRSKMGELTPQQRAMMAKVMGRFSPKPTPGPGDVTDMVARPTGETSKVDGRSCREFELLRGGVKEGEVCATTWKEAGLRREDFATFTALGRFQAEWAQSIGAGTGEMKSPAQIFEHVDGFPLLVRDTSPDGGIRSVTRFKIGSAKPDPKAFDVPTGYTLRALTQN